MTTVNCSHNSVTTENQPNQQILKKYTPDNYRKIIHFQKRSSALQNLSYLHYFLRVKCISLFLNFFKFLLFIYIIIFILLLLHNLYYSIYFINKNTSVSIFLNMTKFELPISEYQISWKQALKSSIWIASYTVIFCVTKHFYFLFSKFISEWNYREKIDVKPIIVQESVNMSLIEIEENIKKVEYIAFPKNLKLFVILRNFACYIWIKILVE